MERRSTSAVPMALVPMAASLQSTPGRSATRAALSAKSVLPTVSSTTPEGSVRMTMLSVIRASA